ncbi:hypothetical protein KP509_28G033700 [Ceratopteris richardii]|uniref:Uncharacterized protein n=1 Tax=Ceratopteris richardii TaxID=49495 RepID=A0A8T2RB15_CERRI|nr:hypothetical protein KP509_28G033700 [Ceratopteris richardii]
MPAALENPTQRRRTPSSPVYSVDSIIADFEAETKNAAGVQSRVLEEILRRNVRTEYLYDRCGLEGRIDVDSFKKRVPIISHSDIKPYFDRIADGDQTPLLTADPVETLSLSSGTTSDGQHKLHVLYKEILEASGYISRISAAYRGRAFPTKPGGMFLELVFCGKLSITKGGIPCGTATTHMFRSKHFKQKQKVAVVRACSPQEVVRHSDNKEAMYCHLLSALLCREEIQFITATFAYTLVEAFHTLELEWRNLCDDIRRGELNGRINDTSLRSAMSKLMPGPNPELADTIEEKCSYLECWAEVIPALWPNCKYIYSIMTGSMVPYVSRLQHYAGSLPLVSADYGSTESWIAVNTNPKAEPSDVTFTVVPSLAYFEFLPVAYNSSQNWAESPLEAALPVLDSGGNREAIPVSLTEVEVGHEYEVLLTTYGGLYRYRLGDVVKVTGFFNSSPQLAYVCRRNVLLTVHIDKNSEKDLQISVDEAMKELKRQEPWAELVDFTSFADLSTKPGRYVVFWELNRRSHTKRIGRHAQHDMNDDESCAIDESLLRQCATTMDAAFVEPGYVGSRKVNTIGALELCVVKRGTFRSLLNRYLDRGIGAIAQYKTPRCVTSQAMRDILVKEIICSVRSRAYTV